MTDEQAARLHKAGFDYRNAHTLQAQEMWESLSRSWRA